MKYGESSFDILYLLFAIISGVVILLHAKGFAGDAKGRAGNVGAQIENETGRAEVVKGPVGKRTAMLMGLAALILGCGDAFHLVPRVLNYFTDYDMTCALGVGKLVTSVTMTVFYVLMYYIWTSAFPGEKDRKTEAAVWCLAIVRVALCLFPQNDWIHNGNSMTWGILRNIPFVVLGAVICWLYFRTRAENRILRLTWIFILLSFLFYIPVAVGAGEVPILGMLMLPKTICYILLIASFLKWTSPSEKALVK